VCGDLYIAGVGLARGYWAKPGLTAERFVPDPFSAAGERMYRTGDVARYREDGTIEFMGRGDTQVKLRGFRIELGEIEAVLARHDAVRTAVAAVRGQAGEQRLVAYAVRAGEVTGSELRAHLERSVPAHMVPQAFVFLDALPLTPNGKIDRKALPEPGEILGEREYVAPASEIEHAIARIWQEVLGVERVGVHDHFFELGGHSLLATRVLSRINQAFDVGLRLTDVFRVHTVAALASLVESTLIAKIEAMTEEETAELLEGSNDAA
jgi:acyl carrier protein